jgi:NitT/TauT family transport system substrate-binding protein
MTRIFRLLPLLPLALLVAGASAACGSDDPGDGGSDTGEVTLRLGYFANVTHAQPLIGVSDGTFAQELGENVNLETKTFNAGPAAIEAMFAGEIDAAYIGPNPAINGYVQSDGKEVRIVSGAASGGASLVVRRDAKIDGPQDFKGKKVATPQLGSRECASARGPFGSGWRAWTGPRWS